MRNYASITLRRSPVVFTAIVSILASSIFADVATLAGHVTYQGNGISGALVRLYLISGDRATTLTATRTSEGGSFFFSTATPGEYIMIISQPPEILYQGKVTVLVGSNIKDIPLSGPRIIHVNEPMGLAYSKQIGLLVLTRSGVSTIDRKTGTSGVLFKTVSPLNFAIGIQGQGNVIVVTQNLSSGATGQIITVFRPGDHHPETQALLAPGRFFGVAIDTDNSLLYLACPKDQAIYSGAIQGNRVHGLEPLPKLSTTLAGPIALSTAQHKLFVAALDHDRIDVVDLMTRKVSQFAAGIPDVGALTVDPQGKSLYVAARKKVLAISLADGNSRRVLRDNLKVASGIAVDDDGGLWIADRQEGIVLDRSEIVHAAAVRHAERRLSNFLRARSTLFRDARKTTERSLYLAGRQRARTGCLAEVAAAEGPNCGAGLCAFTSSVIRTAQRR